MVLTMPDLDALAVRLTRTEPHLEGTEFAFEHRAESIDVTGPWGNRFRCVSPTHPHMPIGLSTVEFDVPAGTTDGIAAFYDEVIGAPARIGHKRCDVVAGVGQALTFIESDQVPAYDGHHLAVYVSNFSSPHSWLLDNDLVVEESDQHQYRFNWIVDPTTKERLFEVEHEVRSQHHPLRGRPLVNKNPDQRVPTYLVGGDRIWPEPI
jgi:hypothetical protein